MSPASLPLLTIALRLSATLFSVAVNVLSSRLLGPEGRGELAVIQSLAMIFSPLYCLTLPYSNSFMVAQDPRRLGSLWKNSALVMVGNGGLLLLLLGLPWQIALWLQLAGPWLWTTSAWSLVTALAAGMGSLALLNRVECWLNLSLIALLAGAAWQGVCDLPLVIWSRTLLNLGASGFLSWRLLRGQGHLAGRTWDPQLFSQSFQYGRQVTLINFLWIALSNYSGLTIAHSLGSQAAGIFAAAVQVVSLALVLANTLASLYFPRFVQLPRQHHLGELLKLLPRAGLALVAFQTLITLSSRYWLIPLLGEQFRPSLPLVTWLAPGYWCLGVQLLLGASLTSRQVPYSYLGLLLAHVGLLVVLSHQVSPWGLEGLAGAFSLSCFSFLLTSLLYCAAFARATTEPDDGDPDGR